MTRLFSPEELVSPSRSSFTYPRGVRFQDVDAAGIVFYPRILEYFHDGYAEFLEQKGCQLSAILSEKSWIAPIRHADAEFLRPLRFGERLDVVIARARQDATSLVVGYQLKQQTQLAAVGQTLHLFLDAKSYTRIPLPAIIDEAFRDIPED